LNARPLPLFTAGISLVILIGLVAALSSQTAPSPSLTLLAREGRRALPITLVADQEFVALDDLAAAFQLAIHEESLGAITVTYKGKTSGWICESLRGYSSSVICGCRGSSSATIRSAPRAG
jgi:hypothetical protein